MMHPLSGGFWLRNMRQKQPNSRPPPTRAQLLNTSKISHGCTSSLAANDRLEVPWETEAAARLAIPMLRKQRICKSNVAIITKAPAIVEQSPWISPARLITVTLHCNIPHWQIPLIYNDIQCSRHDMLLIVAVYCILWNLKPQSQIQYIAKFGVGRLVYLCTLFKSPDPNSETQKSKSSAQCAVASTSDAPFFIMLTFKL